MTEKQPIIQLTGRSCRLSALSETFFTALLNQGTYHGLNTLGAWPTQPIKGIIQKDLKAYKHFPELMIWSAWVVTNDQGIIVGDMGFKGPPDYCGAVEIGYQIMPDYQNRGYATEGVELLLAFAFQKGVEKIEAEVLKSNLPSMRVLEKLGFIFVREVGMYRYYEKVASE